MGMVVVCPPGPDMSLDYIRLAYQWPEGAGHGVCDLWREALTLMSIPMGGNRGNDSSIAQEPGSNSTAIRITAHSRSEVCTGCLHVHDLHST